MRKMFRGYYYPTGDEFSDLWENGIFIFDANILLNIYRYSHDTRELFIKILNEVKDRIIIPHQAAKEYQDNRLSVIRDQQNAYNDIKVFLESELKNINTKLNSYKRHPSINKEEIISDINVVFQSIIGDLNDKSKDHPDLFKDDDLRDELTTLLDGKIWKPCPDEVTDDIWNEGKKRYKDKIPPGYEDKKDKEGFKKCGDLILWYQIIDIAKKMDKPIILVTDDKKEDWWWESSGKTIGPRQELVEEIYNEANVLFYMYKTDNFIKYAEKKFFNIDTDPLIIQEVKDAMSNKEKINRDVSEVIWLGYDANDEIFDANELAIRLKNIKKELNTNKDLLNQKEEEMMILEELIRESSDFEYYEIAQKIDNTRKEIILLKDKINQYEIKYLSLKRIFKN